MEIHAACQGRIWRKWLSSYPTRTVQPVFNRQDHITEDYFGVSAIFPNYTGLWSHGKLDWLEWFSLEGPGRKVFCLLTPVHKTFFEGVSGCSWDTESGRICKCFRGNVSPCFEGLCSLIPGAHVHVTRPRRSPSLHFTELPSSNTSSKLITSITMWRGNYGTGWAFHIKTSLVRFTLLWHIWTLGPPLPLSLPIRRAKSD